jgi:hypothetical protein
LFGLPPNLQEHVQSNLFCDGVIIHYALHQAVYEPTGAVIKFREGALVHLRHSQNDFRQICSGFKSIK